MPDMIHYSMPTKIKVMPDYSSTGLWDGNSGLMLQYDDLNLSDSTIFFIEDWQYKFEFSELYLEPEYRTKEFDMNTCNKTGLKIVEMIKNENPILEVYYSGY